MTGGDKPDAQRGPDSLPRDVLRACADGRQGHVLGIFRLPILAGGEVAQVETPLGVALISQTCDIVQPSRPNVAVAAIVQLHGIEASQAKDGAFPRYVHLSGLPGDRFVDLELIGTIDKATLASVRLSEAGIDSGQEEHVRTFAVRVARRFGRFAFPDEVVAWLRPLQASVKDKYDRPNSGLGRALHEVAELRIEAEDWLAAPLHLILHTVVKAGVIPELDDDAEALPKQFARWLRRDGQLARTPAEISERLYRRELGEGASPTPSERSELWNALGEALAGVCGPRGRDADVAANLTAVREIVGQVSAEDEFNLAQYRRSESLDLDYLSPPVPYDR